MLFRSHQNWVDAATNSISDTLGIKAEGQSYPTFAELLDDEDNDAMTGAFRSGWQADYPSLYNFLSPLYQTGAGSNYGRYTSTEFDDLDAVEAHLRRIHAGFGALSPAEWRHLAETSARMTPGGRLVLHYDPAIAVPMQAGPPADVQLWPLWDALDLPVLLMRGAESGLLTAATAARMAEKPGVTLAAIPGCGHAPALMDPEQTGMIRGFLRS